MPSDDAGTPQRSARGPEPCTRRRTGYPGGTVDEDCNPIGYVGACPDNALRLATCVQDAEREKDTAVAELHRKARADSRKGAYLGEQPLHRRLSD
ncbi:hypothetical protein [Streptomyces europaeiscabiei]|uniref:hypothetical protein n=1 Tax=Streptomyces europaeiscabiei TaxID=146819 RepID=UPI0029BF9D96|nr:hypothetical protein [Streptomyces europaeiscabiei]MDX3585440.1 hypothetical protein [Streptomyces europaeiscabiei]MDX3611846.1 hypothetical protein [Streptomyces europaeiscabiei]